MKMETSPSLAPLQLRRSSERGQADHGWLKSSHSFSFAEYYDPRHMGFHSLRVINEDYIAPGGGFPTHPHRDMEIFTVVVTGALRHQDSMGNSRTLVPGQIQVMSAGSGVTHSEFNPSDTEPVHLLQIWIKPHTANLPPRYTEWQPAPEDEHLPKLLLISQDGRANSATIAQDAEVYLLRPDSETPLSHQLATGRAAWIQLISGALTVNGLSLSPGDAAHSTAPGDLEITASASAVALLFDLATT
jgi:quercetin 2,3-dioxygenase